MTTPSLVPEFTVGATPEQTLAGCRDALARVSTRAELAAVSVTRDPAAAPGGPDARGAALLLAATARALHEALPSAAATDRAALVDAHRRAERLAAWLRERAAQDPAADAAAALAEGLRRALAEA